ncbi:MAG TPA: nitrous oxide reductase family maturation protein NosD [Phnomibacter sp.]|nr:nitrous oxide reductase family maturation protein NosD [Phnomibacter sp.]
MNKGCIHIIVLLLAAMAAQAGIIHAGSKTYPTIRSAIDAARSGDTIMVLPGVYKESPIEVNKRVHLLGRQMPVLDGQLKHEIMTVTADGVSVEGFQFLNSGFSGYDDVAALRFMQCSNGIVRNNQFTNTFFGFYGQHISNCTITGNTFYSSAMDETLSGNGIHCWKSDSLTIKGNKVQGHRDGIYFEFVTNSLIEGNVSRGNARYGLHFMFSNDDVYIKNEFIDNGAGVAVMYSKRVTMLYNSFIMNRGTSAYGILLKDISDSHATGNLFKDNTVGIFMEGSSRLMVTQNQFTGNGWALRIQASCDDVKINRNNFQQNSFDIATNGSLVLNNFDHNYWDKYQGYDLNRNGEGDVPFRPTSLFSMITERNAAAMMLFRSAIVSIIDKAEKIFPGLTPEALKDDRPAMKPFQIRK